jgi:POT family proton-dependent oligopeptide transporter
MMLKNHPKGLRVLFFTEMWERFGFYILMAVFVLYMDKEFGWDDSRKGNLYGFFLGAVYIFPVLGGWIGDKLLGHKRTIRIGAGLMFCGYSALAFSSLDHLLLFYIGLVLVSVGTGIFKVNMSVSVGNLYAAGDPSKDAGFNIYYMGVNLGAAIAPVAATIIHNVYGSYRASFGAAAAGMLVSMVIFESGKNRLAEQHRTDDAHNGGTSAADDPAEDRVRIQTLIILFLIVIFFWIAFYQNGFALTLFAERSTVASDILKPETYQFFNPFFILVLTPPLISLFSRLRTKGKEPSSALKIFLGMFVSGFAMLIMVFAAHAGGDLDRNIMSPVWLISSYFVVTIAEILVSPMGQSFVSKVAPRKIQGLMMGLWFAGTAVGSYGSGLLGRYYSAFAHHEYFLIIAVLLFFSSLLVLLFLKRLKRFAP